ncbi:hypothetical protein MNBD_ALPHA09-2258 [hydrothermal vent metagenome]|uniref:Uncharacterized protein n=1 Tax=hydrothermal vent metagenome TaxID=652676 RepID=A0A3B0SXS9_9ZZZZ
MAVIFFIVVASFAAAGALWLAPSLFWERQRELAGLTERIERALKLAQPENGADSFPETVAVLKTVVKVTEVSGVILLDNQGREMAQIGGEPPVGVDQFQRGRRHYRQAPDGCCVDLYLVRERTGFPYDIVLRIDPGEIHRVTTGRLMRVLGLGAMVLLFGGAAALALLHRFLIFPLGTVRGALADIAAAKPVPILPREVLNKADMIGDLARLITPPDRSYQLAAVPAQGAGRDPQSGLINKIPFEVLSFDAKGALADANDAALWFFQCQSLAELQARDLCVFQAADDPEGVPQNLPELLHDGPLEVCAMVVGRPEPVPCRVLARADRKPEGDSQSLVVCLLPMEEQTDAESQAGNADILALEARVVSLKLLLEACLTLLATPNSKTLANAAQPIRTDILVEDWYLAAARGGLINKQMEHSVPGQVVGDQLAVESLIRHALSFVALRSQSERPVLAGSGAVLSADAVEFVFEEVGGPPVSDSSDGNKGHIPAGASKLPLAALSKLLSAYGGRVLAIRGEDDGNLIRFEMRARPPKTADMAAANKSAA